MLKVLGKRLLVKPVEAKQGTLFIAGSKPSQYEVIGIGDEITRIAVGNIVYLSGHTGAELVHDKMKYLVIDESSILAKID